MTLTYTHDLDILPLDLHAEIQVRMYVCLARRVRWVHTDTQTMSKLLDPTRVLCRIEKKPAKNAPKVDTGKHEGSLGDYRGLGWRQ